MRNSFNSIQNIFIYFIYITQIVSKNRNALQSTKILNELTDCLNASTLTLLRVGEFFKQIQVRIRMESQNFSARLARFFSFQNVVDDELWLFEFASYYKASLVYRKANKCIAIWYMPRICSVPYSRTYSVKCFA